MSDMQALEEDGLDVYKEKDGTLMIYQGDDLIVLSKKGTPLLIRVLQEWVGGD